MPAFRLRIDKSGQKSFVISYTARGRRRIYTLGLMRPSTSYSSSVRKLAESWTWEWNRLLPREIGVTLPDGANPTLGTHLYDGAGDSDPSV